MEDPRTWLFDPSTAHRLVLARRPLPRSAVSGVVSDVVGTDVVGNDMVWNDVVGLLRWAAADAAQIDALGSAALSAFAAQVPWTIPGAAS